MGIFCSKLTVEALKKGVQYVQSYELRHQNDVNVILLVSLFLILSIFHTLLLCCYFWLCKFKHQLSCFRIYQKDDFYTTYSDIKKRVCRDFIVKGV